MLNCRQAINLKRFFNLYVTYFFCGVYSLRVKTIGCGAIDKGSSPFRHLPGTSEEFFYVFIIFLMILQAAKLIGAGLSTIALAGVGTGIGTVFSALITSVARNPHLTKQLFAYAILGFAFTEAVALFALMMAFLILFTF